MTAVGGISIRGVHKRFGSLEALDPVDLEVGNGEIVTLLGPSGCGKTTLLRIVAGLEAPTGGSVIVAGTAPPEARRTKRIGMVPQSPALLPWRTVEANARLLFDVNRSANPTDVPDLTELLREVGLGDFLGAYPHELSGGMQQRVALVRAFALGAPILLLDEPFASLGPALRREMLELVRDLHAERGMTVLMVTHHPDDARAIAGKIAFLEDGSVEAFESTDRMFSGAAPASFRAYIGA